MSELYLRVLKSLKELLVTFLTSIKHLLNNHKTDI